MKPMDLWCHEHPMKDRRYSNVYVGVTDEAEDADKGRVPEDDPGWGTKCDEGSVNNQEPHQ